MINAVVNKHTNYIYHMLAVSQCGYDNEYGKYWRKLHSSTDLEILKKNERLITVSGGSYCGALYWLLVALPACAHHSASVYYSDLLHLFRDGEQRTDISPDAEQWKPNYHLYRDAIIDISEVMVRNVNVYNQQIWPVVAKPLDICAERLRAFLESNEIAKRARLLIDEGSAETFDVLLVSSLENGAEAIDISATQDVLGITHEVEKLSHIICHEYIIFLLKKALCDMQAFQPSSWLITESLAEFYTQAIAGKGNYFSGQENYLSFFEKYCEEKPDANAKELYAAALMLRK